MPDVKALEDAVRSLPPKKLAEFRRWFAEFDDAAWDSPLEEDLSYGKLDSFLAEAYAAKVGARSGARRAFGQGDGIFLCGIEFVAQDVSLSGRSS